MGYGELNLTVDPAQSARTSGRLRDSDALGSRTNTPQIKSDTTVAFLCGRRRRGPQVLNGTNWEARSTLLGGAVNQCVRAALLQ